MRQPAGADTLRAVLQAMSTVASRAMMASGRIVPNLMDVAFSALNDLRHTDAHRVSLSRVRG